MREEGLYWSDVSVTGTRGLQPQGGASRRAAQPSKREEVETDAASIRNLVRMVSLQDEEIKVLNAVLAEERSKAAHLEVSASSTQHPHMPRLLFTASPGNEYLAAQPCDTRVFCPCQF